MARRKSAKPSLEEFAAKAAIDEAEDRDLVTALEARGFMITKDQPRTERRVNLGGSKKTGRVRFGIASDTHLGHRHQQLTHWRDFTEKARKWGAEFMLHGGDVVDGGRMHRDQEFELFKHGAAAQGRYAAEVIPKLGTTYLIGGNHDGSFFNDAGANVFDTMLAKRDDLKFLGAPAAMFYVGSLKIYMMHPDGGVPYARSYKIQKITEQFAPDQKPHIFVTGHWHVTCYVPGYRNVEAFSLPCFQSQTAYLKRKGLAPVIGGLLIDATYSSAGLERISSEFITYHTALIEDYP
jgi:DNA polymerase II small subunit/DNA polymerase delta subunit B